MPRRRFFNPFTELLAALLLVVVVLVVDSWQFSLAVLIAVVLPLVLLSGKPRQIGLALAAVAAPMLISSVLLHGLFFPEGSTVLAGWGPARVTAEGLEFALSMGLRMAVFTGALLTVVMTLDIPELLATMTHRGWNRKLVYVAGSALSLAPFVSGRARHILQAQQARGLVLRRGLPSRLRGLAMVAVPLVVSLLLDAGERSRMLESRGFSSSAARTSYLPDTDTRAQRTARRLLLAGTAAFCAAWLSKGAT